MAASEERYFRARAALSAAQASFAAAQASFAAAQAEHDAALTDFLGTRFPLSRSVSPLSGASPLPLSGSRSPSCCTLPSISGGAGAPRLALPSPSPLAASPLPLVFSSAAPGGSGSPGVPACPSPLAAGAFVRSLARRLAPAEAGLRAASLFGCEASAVEAALETSLARPGGAAAVADAAFTWADPGCVAGRGPSLLIPRLALELPAPPGQRALRPADVAGRLVAPSPKLCGPKLLLDPESGAPALLFDGCFFAFIDDVPRASDLGAQARARDAFARTALELAEKARVAFRAAADRALADAAALRDADARNRPLQN